MSGKSTSRAAAFLATTALAGSLLMLTEMPLAHAQGVGQTGGTAGSASNYSTPGGGGSAAQSSNGVVTGTNGGAGSTFGQGWRGGSGGASDSGGGGGGGLSMGAGGGGGGAGGAGLAVDSGSVTISGATTGGTGGWGGAGIANFQAGVNMGGGGGGGGGGSGIMVNGNAAGIALTINSGVTVTGGDGGQGGGAQGANYSPAKEDEGYGGNGGNGITVQNPNGAKITNNGTITGGFGGLGGAFRGFTGGRGTGVVGANIELINAGTINNGISFTGGTNSLEIRAGSTINGNVGGSGTNTLKLGGTTNSTFDLSRLGGQFSGFSGFEKTGSSTWTVNGTTGASTAWNVSGGTLNLNGATANATTFSNSGSVTIDGTSRLTATNGVTNNSGASLTIAENGAGQGDVDNAGTLDNNGAYTGNVITNTGYIINGATGTWTGDVTSNANGLTNSGTWVGNVIANTGTLINNGIWTGTISNGGTFHNNVGGTVSGLLTNTAGSTTNGGQLNGGATVTGGTLYNYHFIAGPVNISGTGTVENEGSIAGAVTNAATFNNDRTITGTVTNAATFNNNAFGTVSGLLTNTAGTTTNDGQLNGGATVTGGTLINNNLIAGAVDISDTGTVNNYATITGAVTNAGAFYNNAGGTVSGLLTNTAGTTNNAGQLNGGATVTGGTLYSDNLIAGAVNISGTGGVTNGGTITGTVTNAARFDNNVDGIVSGLLTNTAGDTNNYGQLNGGATVTGGTLINDHLIAGAVDVSGTGKVNNNATITGAVTNAATFHNNTNGTVSGLLTSTASTTTNNGELNGGATVSGGTLYNHAQINGAVNISGNGTVENKAGGTVSGLLTNTAGATINAGQLNGGATVTGGLLTNNNLIAGAVDISGTGWVENYASIVGTVTNAATFNNNTNGTVSGLLNTAGTTTNTGQLNGGVLVSGGTFTQTAGLVAGGLGNSAIVNVTGGAINGAIANDAGSFTVGGIVTSDSTFANAAGATLKIDAAGQYTLQGLLTNSGTVDIVTGGELIATAGGIKNMSGGTITVATGATLRDDLDNAGRVTNNGSVFANVAANTGTLVNAAGATWTGNVRNAGTFDNFGALAGDLTSTAGTVSNDGSITGAVNISGGTFTGSGSINGATTISGGTFAPGSTTPGGTVTITGSLAMQAGATYLVQVNPTTASSTHVTGAATLSGANVSANFAAGSYIVKQYTIVSTTAGLSGAFGAVTNTNLPSGFKTALSYDTRNAYLDLKLDFTPTDPTDPTTPGTSPNPVTPQPSNPQAVGNALTQYFNAHGGIPGVYGQLTQETMKDVAAPVATSPQKTTFEAASQFTAMMTDVSGAGRGGTESGSAPMGYAAPGHRDFREAFGMATKAPPRAPTFETRWNVWAAGFGGSQTTDGNAASGSGSSTSQIYGTAVGADHWLSPQTVAGFSLAGGATAFSTSTSGSGRSDLLQAGVFLRHNEGPSYITVAAAYGWQDVTTDRVITVAGVDRLRAHFNTNTYSGRIEAGHRFVLPWIGGLGLTPYGAAQVISTDLPAYAESVVSGSNAFALSYTGKTVTSPRTELGLRTDKSFALDGAVLTLRGRAAWAYDYNIDRSAQATFQALPGASFVSNGALPARNAALTTASAEWSWLNGLSLAATFEGEFSDVTRSYAGKGVVRYAW